MKKKEREPSVPLPKIYLACGTEDGLIGPNRAYRDMAHDEFDSIRGEYVDMLKRQIARSNNGIVRSKYIMFGAPADNLASTRPRLERVEADIMGNFKRLGVQSHVLNGWERLEALHGQLHPGGREPFRFSWGDIPKTGMGTKDFIVPDSFVTHSGSGEGLLFYGDTAIPSAAPFWTSQP